MRTMGGFFAVAGIAGFLYASSQLSQAQPLPPELSVRESIEQPAGKWELIRYGAAATVGLGLLLIVFPKGR